MTKESKRVNAIIDMTLYDNVMRLGYATITEAIIKGLERLLEPQETLRIIQTLLTLSF